MATANFVVKAAPGTSSVPHPRLGTVPVAGMSEKRMLALWLSGSPHVTITAAGLKAYGKQLNAAQLASAEQQASASAKKTAPPAPPAPAPTEDMGAPAPGEGRGTEAPEEADERPRKRGRRGDDTPERASAAE